jgi:asparagine synthase (glutamine-hydrolysing)
MWQTKAIFREAVRDIVPAEILTRKKMGFPVPVGRWLRDDFWPVVQEFVLGPRATARGFFDRASLARMAEEHRSGRARHGDRLWLLVNLEIWQRVLCEGDDPAVVMQVLNANALGQGGRAVAVNDWRAGAKPANRVGAVPAA